MLGRRSFLRSALLAPALALLPKGWFPKAEAAPAMRGELADLIANIEPVDTPFGTLSVVRPRWERHEWAIEPLKPAEYTTIWQADEGEGGPNPGDSASNG